jgi:hypothetical protein
MAESPIVRFKGPVRWVSGPGPAGVTLLGRLLETDGQLIPAQLSLLCGEPPPLPATLPDLTVEALTAQEVLLQSGARDWRLRCSTWQLHRDVGAAFYAAIPPRRTPWRRRFGWRVMLDIAGTALGRWLLARRRRAKS